MPKSSSSTENKKPSTSAKPMSTENSAIKQADIAMISSVPKQLRLQEVVSEWEDASQNKRSHVLAVLPSGLSAKNLLPGIRVEGDFLVGEIEWPSAMSSVRRMLNHSRYDDHYTENHPKWIALQGALDKNMGEGSSFKSKFKINLPTSGYQFTPEQVSGHGKCVLFEKPCLEPNRDGIFVEIKAKATLFCLFDLMIPSKTQCVGMAPDLEDDFEMDD